MKKVDKAIIEKRKMLIEYLHKKCVDGGITSTQLAEMTGMGQPNISRIFSAKYSPTLDTVLILCKALNCHVFIIEKDVDKNAAKLLDDGWTPKHDLDAIQRWKKNLGKKKQLRS